MRGQPFTQHGPGGALVFRQSSAPTVGPDGSFWVDTTPGSVYVSNGSSWVEYWRTKGSADATYAPRQVLDEEHAATTVVDSSAETTLATLTLPAGTVAAGDVLRLVFIVDTLNSSGSSVNHTWRLKLGATTLFASGAISHASTATRRQVRLMADLVIASTAAQIAFSEVVGYLSGGLVGSYPQGAYTAATEDTTVAKNFLVTVQMGTAHLNAEVVLRAASLQLMKKVAA